MCDCRLYDTYIIDIAVVEGDTPSQQRAVVIELNPFAPSTGASLFDWNADSKQLNDGEAVEFRLRTTEMPNVRQRPLLGLRLVAAAPLCERSLVCS